MAAADEARSGESSEGRNAFLSAATAAAASAGPGGRGLPLGRALAVPAGRRQVFAVALYRKAAGNETAARLPSRICAPPSGLAVGAAERRRPGGPAGT
jgi:hypothetical protein